MRLELDARARRWLRRFPRVRVYSVAQLLLLAVLAAQGARLIWTIVTPVDPLGDWRPAQPAVAGSPQEILSGFDPFFRLERGDGGQTVVTSLQLTLFGTRIDEATGRGSAIVAGPDGVQTNYSVGEEISPGVTLKSVAFDHVTIDRGGAAEDLFIDQSKAVAPVAAPDTTGNLSLAPAPAAAAAPIRAAQLRTDIGFIPRVDGGKITGLTVRSQGSGAAFRAAGLQDGDIVTAIGGQPVTGPADIERVGTGLANGGTLSLVVERDGRPVPLSLTIAGP